MDLLDTALNIVDIIRMSDADRKNHLATMNTTRLIYAKRHPQNTISKLQSIQEVFNLQAKEMAAIMDITYKNYWKYITDKTFPTLYSLIKVADYTGISLDWLLDRTDSIYDEQNIARLEELFLSNDDNYPDRKVFSVEAKQPDNKVIELKIYPTIPQPLPLQYSNALERSKYYSLSVRANIIFAKHQYISKCNRYGLFAYYEDQQQSLFNNMAAYAAKLDEDLNKLIYGITSNSDTIHGNNLNNRTPARIDTPLYNLEAHFRNK